MQAQPHVSASQSLIASRQDAAAAKPRVVCDKHQEVSPIEQSVERFMLSRNLSCGHRCFKDLSRSAKTAPRLGTCVQFAPLYRDMALFCRNGQLSLKKTYVALQNLNLRKPMNNSVRPDADVLADIALGVKHGFAKYRMLLNERQYAITMCSETLLH
jgi:hypothetical protein